MSWIQTGRGERCLLGALSHLSLGWHPQAARPTACPETPTESGKNLLSFSLCRQGLPPLAMRRQPGTQLGGCLLQCWALPCLLELTVTGEEAEAPVVPLLSPAKPHGPLSPGKAAGWAPPSPAGGGESHGRDGQGGSRPSANAPACYETRAQGQEEQWAGGCSGPWCPAERWQEPPASSRAEAAWPVGRA